MDDGRHAPAEDNGLSQAGSSADLSNAAAKWLAEDRGAIEAWNAWVEEHGLPLAELRPW